MSTRSPSEPPERHSMPHSARRQAINAAGRASRAGAWLLLALWAALTPFLTAPAAAHEMRPVIATLEMDGDQFRLVLSLNLEAAMAGIGPGHDDTDDSPAAPVYDRLRALSAAELEAAFEPFAPKLAESVALAFDEGRAPLTVVGADVPDTGDLSLPRISEVTLAGQVPAGAGSVSWRLDPALGDSVLRVIPPGAEEVLHAGYVPAGEASPAVELSAAAPQGWARTFASYVRAGFVHIVPKGLDHILFVVGLFLLSTRLSALLWQVSAFTLAHSATLALAGLGLVSVPPAIVEPLIALSIAWVGIENLVSSRLSASRPFVVFGFGLLHGLGFASVLGEVGLPPGQFVTGLVAFNVGVELGQLAVIAACFLAVGWWMRSPFYRRAVSAPSSVAISAVALFWAAQRTGLV